MVRWKWHKENIKLYKLTFPQPDIVQRWGLCDATCGGILSEPEPDIKSTCSRREISPYKNIDQVH